jgi:hypothetical protein
MSTKVEPVLTMLASWVNIWKLNWC